ncbi:MAG: toll/interleukin-1 receptor domain-containing protein [Cyanobacteria bacterium J06634_5]
MRVFISWSGSLSKEIASQLYNWLPSIIQVVDPFFSPEDISKGDQWLRKMTTTLEECSLGIFCVTPNNFENPWLHFEAGAIFNSVGINHVIPILFGGIKPTDITGPLAHFQSAIFQEEDMFRVVKAINKAASEDGKGVIKEERLKKTFSVFWRDLESSVETVFSHYQEKEINKAKPARSSEELLHEILLIVRQFNEGLIASRHSEKDVIERIAPQISHLLEPQIVNLLSSEKERVKDNSDLPIIMESTGSFYNRTFALHQLVHNARDLGLMTLSPAGRYSAPPVVQGQRPLPNRYLTQYRDKIITLLENLASLFEKLAPPGTKVWTALRDRRSDNCYHTFARGGVFNPARAFSSGALPRDAKVVKRLRDSYRKGCCVLLTGSGYGPQMWEEHENDKFSEDKTVMLGAVLTGAWSENNAQWLDPMHAWILAVSADKEKAFSEVHIHLMQTCVVIFSWLANAMIQHNIQHPNQIAASQSSQGISFPGKPTRSNGQS